MNIKNDRRHTDIYLFDTLYLAMHCLDRQNTITRLIGRQQ